MVQKVLNIIKKVLALLSIILFLVACLVPMLAVTGNGTSVSSVQVYLFDLLGASGESVNFFSAIFVCFVLFLAPTICFIDLRKAPKPIEYIVEMIGITFSFYLVTGVSNATDLLKGFGGKVIDSSWILILYAVFLILILLLDLTSNYLFEPLYKFFHKKDGSGLDERLSELENLKANGKISEEEYAEARRSLLNGKED